MNNLNQSNKPTRQEAEDAVRTLISWAGDDYNREGLLATPSRVIKAYEEFFAGYNEDPEKVLSTTFEETHGYDDIVLLKNMRVESHCEHHMVPIIGKAHIAYLPNKRIVGISKIARLLDIYAKRLQTQETMTAQIVETMENILSPKGVAVIIDAKHQCMTTRGIKKTGTSTVTTKFTGIFQNDSNYQSRLYNLIKI
ncbi:MAG: GTP cyclohydrolase I FolE [Rickettsiales bacterium]|jgi:GTP cyclohydrolase IA|nr:GTP cyclohydrolase I FolE [Rickettsiales bacterium]